MVKLEVYKQYGSTTKASDGSFHSQELEAHWQLDGKDESPNRWLTFEPLPWLFHSN